jgi:hypothetical protein
MGISFFILAFLIYASSIRNAISGYSRVWVVYRMLCGCRITHYLPDVHPDNTLDAGVASQADILVKKQGVHWYMSIYTIPVIIILLHSPVNVALHQVTAETRAWATSPLTVVCSV